MKPSDESMPAAPPCGVAEERLEAYTTGDLSPSDRQLLDLHLVDCEDCAEAMRQTASANHALSQLPKLRCPSRLLAAAEAAGSKTLAELPVDASKRTVVQLALAASLALAWFTLPSMTGPSEPVITTNLDAEETKLVLAELREAFRFRAETVKRKVYDQSVAKPVRTVVYAMTDSELGDWGVKAASLFGAAEPSPPDAT